jgi:hypothetical protein
LQLQHWTPIKIVAVTAALLVAAPPRIPAANHREAPITALDRAADITDWFTFVSYDDPTKVTMILNVDPLLEPANGPNYFPFDPDLLYEMHVDNDRDAIPDVTFQFRFRTEIRAPGVFTGFVGAGGGLASPPNAPAPQPPAGTLIVPPAITALDGAGSQGLSLRQTYTVVMIKDGQRFDLTNRRNLFAVPSNVGPRTMPDYDALARQGIYNLEFNVKVFAGTVDDPFYIDLGAAFDSLNFRDTGSGVPGVLTAAQDADDTRNFAPDTLKGYNVNCIALEVPISLINRTGRYEPPSSPDAVIGTYGQTSRVRAGMVGQPPTIGRGAFRNIQRMGNPLINELIIGTGSKDQFSTGEPRDDGQYAPFALDPVLARALNAIYGAALPVPNAPRLDLLPLVQYRAPIAADNSRPGPVADLLRLNTGIPATPMAQRKRLGFLAGDSAGFPNGRRVSDDVTDIAARAVVGVLTGDPKFSGFPHNAIGDGVNTNDKPYQETFPYVAWAHSGRDRVR